MVRQFERIVVVQTELLGEMMRVHTAGIVHLREGRGKTTSQKTEKQIRSDPVSQQTNGHRKYALLMQRSVAKNTESMLKKKRTKSSYTMNETEMGPLVMISSCMVAGVLCP
jgi:hypothetical protein